MKGTAMYELSGQAEGRWIPVSEEAPEVGVSVVGWAGGYPIIVKRVIVDDEACWGCDDEIGQPGWITHFMPLPPPPPCQ